MALNLDEHDDESLMERIQQNDHQAFSILVTRHSHLFYGAAYRVVMNRDDAEDIVQDAFLKIWNNPKIWKSGKGAKFKTWFYRIIMNLSIDKFRKHKKNGFVDMPDDIQDESDNQEVELIEKQNKKELEEAFQTLPEKQLMALNLCFYEGLKNKEAAEIMGVSVKAIESLLMRAKAGVKIYLEQNKKHEVQYG